MIGKPTPSAVARASGNPLLAETMASINDAFAASFALLHDAPDPAPLIHALHWPIFDAIRSGDSAAAREAMRSHFDQLEQALRDRGVGDAPLMGCDTPARPSLPDREPSWQKHCAPVAGGG